MIAHNDSVHGHAKEAFHKQRGVSRRGKKIGDGAENRTIAEALPLPQQTRCCRCQSHPLALQPLQCVDLSGEGGEAVFGTTQFGPCRRVTLARGARRGARLLHFGDCDCHIHLGDFDRLLGGGNLAGENRGGVGQLLALHLEGRSALFELGCLALCTLPVQVDAALLLTELSGGSLGGFHGAARVGYRAARDLLFSRLHGQCFLRRVDVLFERRLIFHRAGAIGLQALAKRLAFTTLFFRALTPLERIALALFGHGNLGAQFLHTLLLLQGEAGQLVATRLGLCTRIVQVFTQRFGGTDPAFSARRLLAQRR